MSTLRKIWGSIQRNLFPYLEDEIGPLSSKEQELVRIIALMNLPEHLKSYQWKGWGRKPKSRLSICKAFIAKSVYQLGTTDLLIQYLKGSSTLRRLCGFESVGQVPSKSTFSRTFAQFANDQVLSLMHEHLIKEKIGDKAVGHISRDSTAISAREKPVPKKAKTDRQNRRNAWSCNQSGR